MVKKLYRNKRKSYVKSNKKNRLFIQQDPDENTSAAFGISRNAESGIQESRSSDQYPEAEKSSGKESAADIERFDAAHGANIILFAEGTGEEKEDEMLSVDISVPAEDVGAGQVTDPESPRDLDVGHRDSKARPDEEPVEHDTVSQKGRKNKKHSPHTEKHDAEKDAFSVGSTEAPDKKELREEAALELSEGSGIAVEAKDVAPESDRKEVPEKAAEKTSGTDMKKDRIGTSEQEAMAEQLKESENADGKELSGVSEDVSGQPRENSEAVMNSDPEISDKTFPEIVMQLKGERASNYNTLKNYILQYDGVRNVLFKECELFVKGSEPILMMSFRKTLRLSSVLTYDKAAIKGVYEVEGDSLLPFKTFMDITDKRMINFAMRFVIAVMNEMKISAGTTRLKNDYITQWKEHGIMSYELP